MKRVVVAAPAKLNLALDVTGVTADGYHTVDMIMQAISLYERVEIVKSMGYSLRLPRSQIPAGEKNTATKAAAVFFRETGLLAGADVIVHKAVPTRAGLAGGSADAAAVLVGLNELYGAKLTQRELCDMGTFVGADVPFSLMGGTARVGGTGEIIQPLAPLPECWFAIAMPSVGVSTPEAYKRYDKMGSFLHPDIGAAQRAIEEGNLCALASVMGNALEYANGGKSTENIREVLDDTGALARMMTGSGAAVFGVFPSEDTARKAAETLRAYVSRVYVAQPVPHGPKVEQAL